jgi:coenzyme F420-reducing hydrogenase beta subunit
LSINITDKTKCCGCEACAQVCAHLAITIQEDKEGFRYPVVNGDLCVECGLCEQVCQYNGMPRKHAGEKYVFGGYHNDSEVRFESTSGGAFSAIVDAYCDENYVIFGAEAKGIKVFHGCIEDKSELSRFRKSKYSQSIIGDSYKQVKKFLKQGKKVLFSGTPCQIAGLRCYLKNVNQDNLLTVEVICEGVPSPLYVRKWDEHLKKCYGSGIASIDYRYTGKALFQKGKWDFEQVKILGGGKKTIIKDRWFNPFWSIWLNHLMSRPSCYKCQFTTSDRVADISLGDLWGVHLYCPELYGKNGGCSLIVCNTAKGKAVVEKAQKSLYGHELAFEDALKYQSPMRKCISENPNRGQFMTDLQSDMTFKDINEKWAKKPTLRLLWQKYVWGNRQKIFCWELKNRMKSITN